MKDVMVDLETLGQRPGCTILSIGAVAFDSKTGKLGEEFYVVVNRESCKVAGLHEDQDTVNWWAKQSDGAREVISHADEGGLMLDDALNKFNEYLKQFGIGEVCVWGNGSDFDNAILSVAYNAVDIKLGWKFWNNRCYRTLKSIIKDVGMNRQGTFHNALDDTKSQATHAIQLLKKI